MATSEITVSISVRLAWWAKPIAYIIVLATWPIVGEKRAMFLGAKVICRGVRIETI